MVSIESLLNFVETTVFTRAWDHELRLDVESDLLSLQLQIMAAPKTPPVIPGTGGLRKLRFAPANWPTGKSGGVRVCYVYFEEFRVVLLVFAYDHRSKDDLSHAEKATIKKLIDRQRRAFENRKAR